MTKKIINFITLLVVLIFFSLTGKYYFSEKNYNLLKKNRSKQIIVNYDKDLNLPYLKNNTNNVIEFKTGYENNNEKKYKKNFWDVFNN